MQSDVRVRANMFDVRHEYLQAGGAWMQGVCHKPGFCRECNLGKTPVLPSSDQQEQVA
jgi:hypothetical protein